MARWIITHYLLLTMVVQIAVDDADLANASYPTRGYYSANFQGCKFSRNAREPSEDFCGCNIRVSMPRNHTHHKLCMGAWEFLPVFNFCADCSALEKRENVPL